MAEPPAGARVLCLLGFEHGARRVHLRSEDRQTLEQAFGDGGGRLACRWLQQKWFLDKFGAAREEALKSKAKGERRQQLWGIALVTPGVTYAGQDAWGQEERLMQHYFAHPVDSFSIVIRQFAPLQAPWCAGLDFEAPPKKSLSFFSVTGSILDEIVTCDDGELRPAREQCARWGVAMDLDQPMPIRGCPVPVPILALIANGAWSKVLLRARRADVVAAGPWVDYPPLDWLAKLRQDCMFGRLECARLLPAPRLKEPFWTGLLENVQQWSVAYKEHMKATLSDDEWGDLVLGINSKLRDFERFIMDMYQPTAGRTSKVRYSAQSLVDTVMHASFLRNMALHKEVSQFSISAVVPKCIRHAPALLDTGALPSKTTIYASLLTIDCAHMLWWRRRQAVQNRTSLMFYWADSSPQGGRDWLLTKFDYIRKDQIVDCLESFHYLCLTYNSLVEQLELVLEDLVADRPPGDEAGDGALLDQFVADPQVLECLRARIACAESLTSQISQHTQAPMGIGSRAASVESKVRALLFGAWLDHGTEAMQAMLPMVVSLTSDLGTEKAIIEYEARSWRSLMPEWLFAAGIEEDGGAMNYESMRSGWLFENGFAIAGLLHIVNNMTLEVDKALSFWAEWLDGLKVISQLLSVGDHRRRFISKCVATSPLRHEIEPLFAKNLPSIAEWRWSTVSNILEPLRKLRWPLQATWSAAKYHEGEVADEAPQQPGGGGGGGGRASLDLAKLSRTIANRLWWHYTDMLFTLHKLCDSLGSWGESCPCHQFHENTDDVFDYMAKENGFPTGKEGRAFQCPMRGRRAPELAAGQLMLFFERLWSLKFSDLASEVAAVLAPSDIRTLMTDLEGAKQHVTGVLVQKLQHWQGLPWRLCAMSHWDKLIVKQAASDCLAMFDAVAAEERWHHPVTWRFLHRGSPLRPLVEAAAQSGELGGGILAESCAPFAFIPVVERLIERGHTV